MVREAPDLAITVVVLPAIGSPPDEVLREGLQQFCDAGQVVTVPGGLAAITAMLGVKEVLS